jgi:hypothetical protein
MRRLLQFRIRTLFAVVSLLAVLFASFGNLLRGWQIDLQAIAALHPTHVQFVEAGQVPFPLLL